jgi:hypothetical protein
VSRIDVEEGELTIELDGGELSYGFGELDELVLAYATTIHKSQGSEYPDVVIPLSTAALPDAPAELGLYGSDARQASGGACRAADGTDDCRQGERGSEAVVEAAGGANRL